MDVCSIMEGLLVWLDYLCMSTNILVLLPTQAHPTNMPASPNSTTPASAEIQGAHPSLQSLPLLPVLLSFCSHCGDELLSHLSRTYSSFSQTSQVYRWLCTSAWAGKKAAWIHDLLSDVYAIGRKSPMKCPSPLYTALLLTVEFSLKTTRDNSFP